MLDVTTDSGFTRYAADKLIGDKAHDSDSPDQLLLEKRNIEMTTLHRKERKKPKTRDGRKLRRY